MTNKKTATLAGACLVCVLVVFAAMNFTGCEDASGLTGLTITPSVVQVNTGSNSNWVDFVVSGVISNTMALPIQWTVSKPELGYIAHSSGFSARYFRYAVDGDNVIIARDQYDNEGYALVKQTGSN